MARRFIAYDGDKGNRVDEVEVFMVLGVCFLGTMMVLVPFLLHHQRKMAEIVHSKSQVADGLSKRLDTLTESVFQLATRVEHASGRERVAAPPPMPELLDETRPSFRS